jgi:hypothetical protein
MGDARSMPWPRAADGIGGDGAAVGWTGFGAEERDSMKKGAMRAGTMRMAAAVD